MFGFKKKKQESLPELPPPPSPPEFPMPEGDIPGIRADEELKEFPTAPSFEHEEENSIDLPDAPAPDMPEAPEPGMDEENEAPSFEQTGHVEPFVPENEEAPPIETLPEITHDESKPYEIAESETVRRPVGPAFVSVDDYRSIMEHSNRVRSKLSEAEEFMHRLVEIKADEEKTFEKWRSQLEDIERKLGQIDKVIAKAKR